MSGAKAIKVGILGLGNIGAGTVEIPAQERRAPRAAPRRPVRAREGRRPRPVARDAARARAPGLHDRRERGRERPRGRDRRRADGGVEPARSLTLAAMEKGSTSSPPTRPSWPTHGTSLPEARAQARVARVRGQRGRRHPAHPHDRGAASSPTGSGASLGSSTAPATTSSPAWRASGKPFAEILADAQANGYAEANPRSTWTGSTPPRSSRSSSTSAST